MEAATTRALALDPRAPLTAGEIEVRPAEFRAFAAGRPLALTAHELALLAAMIAREGRIVGRQELCLAAWDRQLARTDRSVDVYVRRLRRKLAAALPERRFIHTHFGFGYRFEPEISSGRSHLFHTAATAR